jgi:FKBP-type peptidyl-prolyl cis-trans isomerase 2
MDRAERGDTVLVTYTGTLEDGTVFDQPEEPQQVAIGRGEINPAFEEALIGMAPGETRTIVLPAEKAYGPYRKKLVFRLKRRDLNLPEEPVPGGTARISLKNGRSSLVTVLKADAKTVTVDANHPLAGKDLTFSITLLGIRKGSDE